MSTPKKLVLNFDDPNEYVLPEGARILNNHYVNFHDNCEYVLPEHASILNKHLIDEVRNMFTYTNTTTENRRDRLAEIVFKTKLPEWKCSAELLAYHCYQYADAMIAEEKEEENEEEKPKVVKINLNDKVRVKLTDHGRAVCQKHWGEPPKEDADGWSTWQLWVLMQEFGQHMYLGCPSPFEDIEVIE